MHDGPTPAPVDVPLWAQAFPRPGSSWHPLGPLEGDATTDLAVVGLGGSGLAAIEAALDSGVSVIGIDAGAVAGEAAGRNGGFLLAGPELPYHRAVAEYGHGIARDFYALTEPAIATMAASHPDTVRRSGSLRIATAEGESEDVAAELRARSGDGFSVESYSGPEGDGFLIPGDAAMNPLIRVRTGMRRALARGAVLHERTPAISLAPGRVVTPQGTISSAATVVAIDGRLEVLVPELAGRVRTARLQMLGTAPLTERRFPRPVYAHWGYVYWQQLPDGRLALGGHRQLHEHDEWTRQPGPSGAVQHALESELARMGVTAAITHRWAGHSAYTRDRRPVFEEIHRGTVVVGGYSGHGNVTGAIYATEAVRYLLSGSRSHTLLG